MKTLIVVPPFLDAHRPALGPSLLKGGLARRGLTCDVLYLNVRFCGELGQDHFEAIDNFSPSALLGEWLFSEGPSAKATSRTEAYFYDILLPLLEASLAGRTALLDRGSLLKGLDAIRLKARAAVELYASMSLWGEYGVVGFSTSFQQTSAALALARRVKANNPKLLVVFGGANCEGRRAEIQASQGLEAGRQ